MEVQQISESTNSGHIDPDLVWVSTNSGHIDPDLVNLSWLSKAPETSPFHQLNIDPSMYSTHFVCIPRVLELL